MALNTRTRLSIASPCHLSLQGFGDEVILFESASTTTLRISSLLAAALQQLLESTHCIDALIDHLDIDESEYDGARQHLLTGLRHLVQQGILIAGNPSPEPE